jgi:hypothetical protein
MPNSKYGTFRNRTDVNTNVTIRQASEFIEKSASSVEVLKESTSTNIKAVIIPERKESGDEIILFTYSSDQVNVGEYITHLAKTYLVYSEYKIAFSQEFKKHQIIECNVDLKFGNISQKAYYVGSLRRYQALSSVGADFVLNYSAERPIVITKENSNIKSQTRFLLKGEPFKVEEVDKLSNSGIMYLSLSPDTIFTGVDDVSNNTTNEIEEPTEPTVSNVVLAAGSIMSVDTNGAYFKTNYDDIEVITKTATKVEFFIPFGINELVVSIKDENNDVVTTTYQVVI